MPQAFPNQLITDLEDVLSSPRFATYLRVTGGDRQRAAQLYCWNTEVSAAFYTPLQFAEIGAARNLWACLGDLKRPISFSRFRVDLCDPSIRLFSPLCAL